MIKQTPEFFIVKESNGYRYQAPKNDAMAEMLEAMLASFQLESEEKGVRGPLSATAKYETPTHKPIGQNKSMLSWEWDQRKVKGNGIVIVPSPDFAGTDILNPTGGHLQVWVANNVELASSLAAPGNAVQAVVLDEPAAGWGGGAGPSGKSAGLWLAGIATALGIMLFRARGKR